MDAGPPEEVSGPEPPLRVAHPTQGEVEHRVRCICPDNGARSRGAEAVCNRGPPPGGRALSAGRDPAGAPHPRVAALLREIGLALPGHAPQRVNAEMVQAATLVVTIGGPSPEAAPAYLLARLTEEWPLPDPAQLPEERARQVRDQIRAQVASLISRIGVAELSVSGH